MTREDAIVLCEEALDKIDELHEGIDSYGELGIVVQNLSDLRGALVNGELNV